MWGWDEGGGVVESEESGMRVVLGVGMGWGWRWAGSRERERVGRVHSPEAKNMMPVEKGRERRVKVGC